MGFTERSDFYGVQGGSMKNQYIAQKGRLWHFVDLRGGLARKRGAVILRGGLIPQCTLWSNWIIQILHYYCRKQHKNIKNSDYWTKCCYLSLSVLPSAYCDLRLLHLPQQQRFSVLGHSTPQILNVTSDHCAIYSFVFWFENGFIQVKPT